MFFYYSENQPKMLYKYFNILLRQLFCRVAKRLYLCINKQTNYKQLKTKERWKTKQKEGV